MPLARGKRNVAVAASFGGNRALGVAFVEHQQVRYVARADLAQGAEADVDAVGIRAGRRRRPRPRAAGRPRSRRWRWSGRRHQPVRQVADEADGVGQQTALGASQTLRVWVSSGEEASSTVAPAPASALRALICQRWCNLYGRRDGHFALGAVAHGPPFLDAAGPLRSHAAAVVHCAGLAVFTGPRT